METIASFLEQHMMGCFYKSWLGLPCPGCGFQRAFILLLRGEFWLSIEQYPPLIPILLMLLLLLMHLRFDFKYGAKALRITFFINVTIIVANFIWKNIYVFSHYH